MKQYHDLLCDVIEHGSLKSDRTGVGTLSVFGRQTRFDLRKGFPLLTTKKLHTKSIMHELLWFLKGDTNVRYLQDNGVTVWNEWADEKGDLGRVYGAQWCDWRAPDGRSINQIHNLVEGIKKSPDSRRHIVSAWNPGEIEGMALPPCHALFQFYVANGKLDAQLYQRSADLFLGVPFNTASYALLTHMVAQVTGLQAGAFVHTFGDLHLYTGRRNDWYGQHREELAEKVRAVDPLQGREAYRDVAQWIRAHAGEDLTLQDHVPLALEQLAREPRNLPILTFTRPVSDIFCFVYNDFKIESYDPHPPIKAGIAV